MFVARGGRQECSSRDFVKSIHTDISSAGFVKRLRQESSSRELANRIRQESSCVGAPKISPKCSKHKSLVVGASPWNVCEKSYKNSDIGIGGRPWQVVFPPSALDFCRNGGGIVVPGNQCQHDFGSPWDWRGHSGSGIRLALVSLGQLSSST